MKILSITFFQSFAVPGFRRVATEYSADPKSQNGREWVGWDVWMDDHSVYLRAPAKSDAPRPVTRVPASTCAVTYEESAEPEPPKRRTRQPRAAKPETVVEFVGPVQEGVGR